MKTLNALIEIILNSLAQAVLLVISASAIHVGYSLYQDVVINITSLLDAVRIGTLFTFLVVLLINIVKS